MKIALAQIDVKAGLPEVNQKNMLHYIEEAKKQEVELIAFPELCLPGYLIGDLWLNDEYCKHLMSFNEKIIEASEGIVIIWGNIFYDEREALLTLDGREVPNVNDGGLRRRYNAAYAYLDKKPLRKETKSSIVPDGVQFKVLLPNYRYFDDKRYFSSPLQLVRERVMENCEVCRPFKLGENIKDLRVGVQLCEDMWSADYNCNPTKLILGYSDFIVNISASPWTFGKNDARDRRVKEVVDWEGDQRFFAYLNCVGAQNTGKNILTFDGGSTVYFCGKPIKKANTNFEEELLIYDSKNAFISPKKTTSNKMEQKFNAIVRGIKHMTEITGIEKFVIATSGGIDSSLVLTLLAKTISPDMITAVNMPSQYNSEKTKNASQKICNNLGIKDYRIIPIQEIVDLKIKTIFKDKFPSDLSQENIQAETRAMILSAIAGNEKALFTCNANKLEIASGYFTLNADGRGAICPIGDLLKLEVYDMARWFNKQAGKEAIPNELIPDELYQFDDNKIEPSAELKNSQKDPFLIGYHDMLLEQMLDYRKVHPDTIAQWWIDNKLIEKLGIDPELMNIYNLYDGKVFIDDLKWFCEKMRANVFKRVQSPPICVISKSAFGYDLRESILPKE